MRPLSSHVSCKIILLTLALQTALTTSYEPEDEPHHIRHSIVPQQTRPLCPTSCHCKGQRVVCRDRLLSDLQLPAGTESIEFFNVKTTILQGIDFNPDTVDIIYRSSDIYTIGANVFKGLQKLQLLNLADNIIETIPATTLTDLINLRELNLRGNTIHHFAPQLFQNLTLLKQLHLADNHLHVSQPVIFEPLVSLRLLDLSNNKITSIIDRFKNKNLANLSLSYNSIRDLHAHTFADLANLIQLDLSANVLDVLPDNLFQKTYQLQHLDLSRNHITSIASTQFSSLKKLRYLQLNNNNIDYIPDNLFASNLELQVLNLADNHIQHLTANQAIGLTSLKQLNMHNNKRLNAIDLASSNQLENIDLSNNNLTRPPEFLKDLSTTLQSVKLYNNTWLCDCQMKWYIDWAKQLTTAGRLDKQSDTCTRLAGTDCQQPISSRNKTIQLIEMRSNATIDCNIDGSPFPSITWVTPMGLVLHYNAPNNTIFSHHPLVHNQDMSTAGVNDRIKLIDRGVLYINYVMRTDAGQYVCFASNPLANLTTYITVHLDRDTFYSFKLTSIIIGISCAVGFLLMTAIGHLVVFIFKKCGWTCCCITEEIPRVKQFYQMMEGLEHYKTQQLDRLRENYTQQVHKIKDNCAEQVDWIRDSYQGQVKHLRDIRDYGTHHLSSIRDQYLDQMKKVRDYSTGQLSWVRENYVFQRNRIRKFSTHQVLRFRETYKYQQQTLNKILENLPNLYLDNCRSGSCGRSDSSAEGLDEADIAGIDVYIKRKIDSLTKPSQLDDTADDQSVYYTPSELSESPRSPNRFNQFPCIPSEDEGDESSTVSLKPNYNGAFNSRQSDEIPAALSRRIFLHRSAFIPIDPDAMAASSSHNMADAEETSVLLRPSPLTPLGSGSTPWLRQLPPWPTDIGEGGPCHVFKPTTPENSTSSNGIKPSASLPTLQTVVKVKDNNTQNNETTKDSNKTLSLETAL